MGRTSFKLESGQKGESRGFLPISALGNISISGNISFMVCGGSRFCKD